MMRNTPRPVQPPTISGRVQLAITPDPDCVYQVIELERAPRGVDVTVDVGRWGPYDVDHRIAHLLIEAAGQRQQRLTVTGAPDTVRSWLEELRRQLPLVDPARLADQRRARHLRAVRPRSEADQ